MIYLTRTRLMRESERTVYETASRGEPLARGICSQLLADQVRYYVWRSRHENRMEPVASLRRRELQLVELRRASIELVHRAALVKYLRDYHVRGTARDGVLREFYGALDAREAAILEHRNYLIAASSQICATELLELADDRKGVEQIELYESAYSQYFGLFCARTRAEQLGAPFMLDDLIPEVHGAAERLRLRILSGYLLPNRAVRIGSVAA